MPAINATTRLYVSLSARASSNGVYFYNALFHRLGINAVYLSTPTPTLGNLRESLALLGVQGAAIAAPFKTEVIDHLDELTDVARVTGSVNCIRRMPDGRWLGHNTDESGLRQMLLNGWVPSCHQPVVLIYGSGGVVPSVVHALRTVAPTSRILLQARNISATVVLAASLGLELVGVEEFGVPCDLFINATPSSISDAPKVLKISKGARVVFDLPPVQDCYAFESEILARGQMLLRGFDYYLAQFAEQFLFFTGLRPDSALLDELVFAR